MSPRPPGDSPMETIMRFAPLVLALGLGALSLSSMGSAQRRDDAIDPLSLALVEQATATQAKGNLDGAIDLFEAALVADPRNRAAIIGLAQIARAQSLPGKAVSLYRDAQALDPSDVTAVVGEGEALVQKGAIGAARDKLTAAQALCGAADCSAAAPLRTALASADTKQVVKVEAVTPTATAAPQPN